MRHLRNCEWHHTFVLFLRIWQSAVGISDDGTRQPLDLHVIPGVHLGGVAVNEGGSRVEITPWDVADAALHTVRVDALMRVELGWSGFLPMLCMRQQWLLKHGMFLGLLGQRLNEKPFIKALLMH